MIEKKLKQLRPRPAPPPAGVEHIPCEPPGRGNKGKWCPETRARLAELQAKGDKAGMAELFKELHEAGCRHATD